MLRSHIHFINHKNAQLLKNPQTVKRQSGKSKICKNYAQNPQYLGEEGRFTQGAVLKCNWPTTNYTWGHTL